MQKLLTLNGITKLCVGIMALLALIVMYGWFTNNAALVQVRPDFTPMKFNTAFSLLLCSVAWFFIGTRLSGIGALIALISAVFNALTLSQYFVGDLGVDRLFVEPFTTSNSPIPGRMAPNTAFALILLSKAVFLSLLPQLGWQRKSFLVAMLGSLVVALGLAPLLGYLGGVNITFAWWHYTRMAVHSTLCFISFGVVITFYAWKKKVTDYIWLPFPVFVGFVTIAVSLSTAVSNVEDIKFHASLQTEAENIASRADLKLADVYKALDRIGSRWYAADGTTKKLWEHDANEYLKGYKFLFGLSRTDKDTRIIWQVSRADKIVGMGFKLNSNPARAEAIKKALETKQSQQTSTITLLTGDKGFLYITPLYSGKEYQGLQTAGFRIKDLFGEILLQTDRKKFNISITENSEILYSSGGVDKKDLIWQGSAQLSNEHVSWVVNVSPRPESLALKNSLVPTVILIIGILTAFLISLCTYLALKTNQKRIEQRVMEENNANIMRQEQKRLSDIVAIQRDVAHAHHDLQYAMDLIAEHMRIITNAESGVIEMLEGDEMVYRAASGNASEHVGLRISIENSLSGLCTKMGITLKCDDTENDIRVNKDACRKIGVTSMMVVPLFRDSKVVGVLKVLSSKPAAFNEKHNATLELLAGVLSAAISDALVNDNLRQSEETFRSALLYAPIGMALVSLEGKWLKVNQALCSMIGYEEEQLLKTDFQTITHPEDLASDMEHLKQVLDKEIESYQMEKRYFHKDGHIIWVLLSVSLVWNTDGTPKYFISQIENITDRKFFQEQQEEIMKKLVDSNTELERFAYVASHDMQEPLRMIANFSSILHDEYNNKFDEDGQEYLHLMTEGALRMQAMVSDLLEYARVGNEARKIEEVSAEKELRHVRENLASVVAETGAKITSDELPSFSGNPVQIMRLMQNLIGNGLKYQAANVAPKVHVGVESQQDKWVFSIKDNGIGMTSEQAKTIFEPFKRLHTWEQYKGTGIGLAVCKKIVENHGGTIWVESMPDQGSTFYFSLLKKQEVENGGGHINE